MQQMKNKNKSSKAPTLSPSDVPLETLTQRQENVINIGFKCYCDKKKKNNKKVTLI